MVCIGVSEASGNLLGLRCLKILRIVPVMPAYILPSLGIGIAQLIWAESNHRSILFMQAPHEFELLASHGHHPERYAAEWCPPRSRELGKRVQGIRIDDGPDPVRHKEGKQGQYGRAGRKPFSKCEAHTAIGK